MSFTRYHMLTLAVMASMQQTAFAQTSTYNIAIAPLSQTMAQIARQNGVSLSADPELLHGKTAPAIKGNYHIDTAFNLALVGSGLQLIKNADGTVYSLINMSSADKPHARDMGQLKTIDVAAIGTAQNNQNNAMQLPLITVYAEKDGSAEDGYLVKNITGVGLWGERSLQDTPYSMSVISGNLIENVIAKDMNQIFKMNPTTQETQESSDSAGATQVYIRGFQVANPIINGISYANQYTISPMMQDIERVEIISGATGFLYGGGRVGGAVNYVTKKSTAEDLRTVTIGSYGNESYYAHVDLGGQFDENYVFGYRINALYQDGELPSAEKKEQKALSLLLDWKPSDNFYTDFKYAYKDSSENAIKDIFNTWSSGLTRSSIKSNQNFSPDWLNSEAQSDKFENNIKWTINDIFTLRTNIFYEKLISSGSENALLLKDGIIHVKPNWSTYFAKYAEAEHKNHGANIFLDASFNTGNISHTLTTGYSFSSSRNFRSSDYRINYLPSENIALHDLKNLPEPDWDSIGSLVTQPYVPWTKHQFKNILIGDDIKFSDQWSALIGFNYADISQFTAWNNYSHEDSKLTPTLSVIYKPFDALTTYATYIESLEAGTVVGNAYINAGNILPPYTSKQYELGAKYNLNDRSLFTASLFRIEKANSYVDNSTIATQGKPKQTQDGEQIHQGLELALTGKVTENLTLLGGITLMDLGLKKVTNAALIDKKPTDAVSNMAKIYAEYQIPSIEGLSLSAGAYYTGKKFADNENTDILPAYTLFDAGARYSTKLGQYPTTFNLTAQNLTDKVYWTHQYSLGDPRTVAFSVKTQF